MVRGCFRVITCQLPTNYASLLVENFLPLHCELPQAAKQPISARRLLSPRYAPDMRYARNDKS
jgi:hypothetical protein